MSLELVALGCALRDAKLGMGEEGGNNRGPYVRSLLANLDPPLAEGAPWCAAAVQSWSDNAAQDLGVPNPLDAIRREALVQDYHDQLRDRIVPANDVRPGCLVLFNFGGQRWDHIGLVVRPPQVGSSLFVTVEGNTSAESERDGDAVAKKTRRLDSDYPVTFIDWTREDWE